MSAEETAQFASLWRFGLYAHAAAIGIGKGAAAPVSADCATGAPWWRITVGQVRQEGSHDLLLALTARFQ